jgi:hypothetical protein
MKMVPATAVSLSVILCLEVFVASVARCGDAGYEARIVAEPVVRGECGGHRPPLHRLRGRHRTVRIAGDEGRGRG